MRKMREDKYELLKLKFNIAYCTHQGVLQWRNKISLRYTFFNGLIREKSGCVLHCGQRAAAPPQNG